MLAELLVGAMRAADMGAGLARNGMELEAYTRRKVGAWDVEGRQARSTVEFGPFPATVEFDEVLLRSQGGVERIRLRDAVRLPQGMVFRHEFVVTVDG